MMTTFDRTNLREELSTASAIIESARNGESNARSLFDAMSTIGRALVVYDNVWQRRETLEAQGLISNSDWYVPSQIEVAQNAFLQVTGALPEGVKPVQTAPTTYGVEKMARNAMLKTPASELDKYQLQNMGRVVTAARMFIDNGLY
jgi:hypothetical protein